MFVVLVIASIGFDNIVLKSGNIPATGSVARREPWAVSMCAGTYISETPTDVESHFLEL